MLSCLFQIHTRDRMLDSNNQREDDEVRPPAFVLRFDSSIHLHADGGCDTITEKIKDISW